MKKLKHKPVGDFHRFNLTVPHCPYFSFKKVQTLVNTPAQGNSILGFSDHKNN